MLDGLAFLPVSDVTDGVTFLRQHIPDVAGLIDLVDYFEATYVQGSLRRIRHPQPGGRLIVRLRRSPAMFPPGLWNVHDATIIGEERTNNVCEGWNHAFANIVGHHHPSIWKLLEALQMDEALASTDIMRDARGQPPTKRIKRSVEQHQRRLLQLCVDRRDGRRSVGDTLRALGHCIRLSL
jgi:hypothetical protein